MKILIADDDLITRTLLHEILRQYGDCVLVEDGQKAVDAYKSSIDARKPFTLVCLDIMMPRLDGIEALIKIREIEKKAVLQAADKTRVVMLTALNDSKTVVDAFYKGGANTYIVKPINKEKLINEITSLGLIK